MKRSQAERLVIAAARKVAETHPKNYPYDQQYIHVIQQRVVRLQRAIRDLDHAIDDKEVEESISKDKAGKEIRKDKGNENRR